jgi:hypothetical protein
MPEDRSGIVGVVARKNYGDGMKGEIFSPPGIVFTLNGFGIE